VVKDVVAEEVRQFVDGALGEEAETSLEVDTEEVRVWASMVAAATRSKQNSLANLADPTGDPRRRQPLRCVQQEWVCRWGWELWRSNRNRC